MMKCSFCTKEIPGYAEHCPFCGADLTDHGLERPTIQTPVRLSQILEQGLLLNKRYKIIEKIGQGGIGIVYRALDTFYDGFVALKTIKSELAGNEQILSRFKREIRVNRRVKHPNVCTIYNYGSFEGIFYIIMEYIPGENLLLSIRDKNRFSFDDYMSIAVQIAQGLHAAHRENIIHRDLKPSNIIITTYNRPKIMDFGLARYIGQSDITRRDEVMGTPYYLSPEAFKANDIDHRSDIYSYGVMLYEMFTGILPFRERKAYKLAMLHIKEEPVPPRQINKELPEKLEDCILKCLAKSPDDRYQSVYEIIHDLESMLSTDSVLVPNRKILVVDDNPNIVELIVSTLEIYGYEWMVARNGEEAIAKTLEDSPALILMDLMMPKMDGFQALEFLRAHDSTAHIPVIMVTAKDEKDYKNYGKSIGIVDYITKPFELDYLMGRIQDIIGVNSD